MSAMVGLCRALSVPRTAGFGAEASSRTKPMIGRFPPRSVADSRLGRRVLTLVHRAAGQFGGFLLQASEQAVCTNATYQRPDLLLLRYDLTNRAVCRNVNRLPASRCLAHRVTEDVRIVARLARHDLDLDHSVAGRRRM